MINQAVASLMLIHIRDEIADEKKLVDSSEKKCADLDIKYSLATKALYKEQKGDNDPMTVDELQENCETLSGYLTEFMTIWQMWLAKLGQSTETYNLLLKLVETDIRQDILSGRK